MRKAVGVVWQSYGFDVVHFELSEQPGHDYFQWQVVTNHSKGHYTYREAVEYAKEVAKLLRIRNITGNEQREPVYLSPLELLVFNLKDN